VCEGAKFPDLTLAQGLLGGTEKEEKKRRMVTETCFEKKASCSRAPSRKKYLAIGRRKISDPIHGKRKRRKKGIVANPTEKRIGKVLLHSL